MILKKKERERENFLKEKIEKIKLEISIFEGQHSGLIAIPKRIHKMEKQIEQTRQFSRTEDFSFYVVKASHTTIL